MNSLILRAFIVTICSDALAIIMIGCLFASIIGIFPTSEERYSDRVIDVFPATMVIGTILYTFMSITSPLVGIPLCICAFLIKNKAARNNSTEDSAEAHEVQINRRTSGGRNAGAVHNKKQNSHTSTTQSKNLADELHNFDKALIEHMRKQEDARSGVSNLEIDYKKLAKEIFDIGVEIANDYGKVIVDITNTQKFSPEYFQHTTGLATMSYTYGMMRIREKLCEIYDDKMQLERADNEMIEVFADILIESPVALAKSMDYLKSADSAREKLLEADNMMPMRDYLDRIDEVVDSEFDAF